MNWKSWLPLVLAIVMGAVAAKVGRDMLLKQRGQTGAAAKTAQLAVANVDMEAGHLLMAEDVRLSELPAEGAPRGAYSSAEQLVGRVLATSVVAGQSLLENVLSPQGTGSGLQSLVPRGLRAATIDVNDVTGVAGMLQPGCRVDVITVVQDGQSQKTIARTIVENVVVLAIGQRTSAAPNAAQDAAASAAPTRAVTLLVSPRDAEVLELAGLGGRNRLVLRGSFDSAISNSNGVTIAELVGGTTGQTSAMTAAVTTQPAETTQTASATTQPTMTRDMHRVQFIRAGQESWQVIEKAERRTLDDQWTGTDTVPLETGRD